MRAGEPPTLAISTAVVFSCTVKSAPNARSSSAMSSGSSPVPGDPGGGASALEAALPLVAPPAPVAAAVVSAPSPVTTGPGACGGAGGGPSKTGGGPSKTDGGPSVTGGGASAAAVAPMSAPAAEGKDDMLSSPAEDAVEPARVSRPAEDNGFGEPLSPPPCEGVAIAS